MITLHHLENSRSQRVLWLLEELGLEYQVRRYARDPVTSLAPPELQAVHPLGKSPVITDGDLTIAETGAIIEYLVEIHGNGRLVPPKGSPDYLRYRYWMHAAEGTVMPYLVMQLVFNRIEGGPSVPFFLRPISRAIAGQVKRSFITPNLDRVLAHMEAELGKSTWFAGEELTAADVQMSFPVEAAAARAGLRERSPKLAAFLDRVHARPAYAKALEAGGPYRLMTS